MIDSKEKLFQTICNASRLGTLGFFVGTGFSKSVLKDNPTYLSFSWNELLQTCCEEFDLGKSILESSRSYPELATNICKAISDKSEKSYEESVKIFKAKVCELTNVYPEPDQRENFGRWFNAISPVWIVTTNYDTLIESVLGGVALQISPQGFFCNINGRIPVFHLHGICNEPDEIVITNEDYAHLFRPNDYRQARLPFLMKESCVLMIGYGLGDLNVITAVDWANNVYTNVNEGYNFPIIQLLYTESPKGEPYMSEDGVVIYEMSGLEAFFTELCGFKEGYKGECDKRADEVERIVKYLSKTDEDNLNIFIDNVDNMREEILEFFKNLEQEFGYAYNSFFPFVRAVISKLDEKSKQPGEFGPYNKKLCVILDILISVPIKKIPSSFFGMLASELNAVGAYIRPDGSHSLGSAFVASDSWVAYKNRIPRDVIDELWRFAKSSREYTFLKKLLHSISS